ncbi:metal-dependent hydrolase [Thermodesulforhabdus norvegica]|uniref:Inner membrane protein n=1 Tax=Thermodesulforhabdus norvegica TaxID=39841 RepID=A0A1I4QLK9_9BACT|nr:metal-dependent hydrolase [Thermodesulforhabdus norvegica]SFM40600.1 inner membrane protein [Thermodesulforhabdus norvegica]
MDPITHGVSGLIGAKFLKLKFTIPARYGWLFFVGALLPDIDNIAGFFGREAYIVHHRGFTHSLFFALFFPALVALLLRLLSSKWNVLTTWITLTTAMFIHIFLDVITSYGTQIFLPFSRHRFALDWVFIVDPLFTGILIILLSLSRWKQSATTVALLTLFCYPMICGAMGLVAERKISSILPPALNHRVIPELGTPFYWKVIAINPGSYKMARFFLPGMKIEGPEYEFARANFLKTAEKDASIPRTLRVYDWFAIFPFQTSATNPHKNLILGDLRFVSTWRVPEKVQDIPFSLVVSLDDSGKIKEAYFIE